MKRRVTAIAAAAAIAAALLAGCGNQLNDQGGVPQRQADYELTYLNVDNFPNITMLCIDGAGFATTTRDAAGAILAVPEWDSFCAAHEKAAPVPAPSATATP